MQRLRKLAELGRRFNSRERCAEVIGRVTDVRAGAISVEGLSAFTGLGDLVNIETTAGSVTGEVMRIDRDRIAVMPYADGEAIGLGAEVRFAGSFGIRPHDSWCGRVIDPLCRPIDGLGALTEGSSIVGLDQNPPPALERQRVERPIQTGVKAIDVFAPLCEGQRIGIFAGSGVGKSTLLSMLAALPGADVVVLALVGERSREVKEFIEDILGAALARSVVVAATGDDSSMMRRLAPKTALAVAEHFRDSGRQVLLIVDSLTRFAHAQREFALAAGEAPIARGYPPSVFQQLARLLERAGPGGKGSGAITFVGSVLIDGDDHNDPVADAVRGILDGHIVLDRRIAALGRWPAIDIMASVSRLAPKAWSPAQKEVAQAARSLIARYEETKDLRMLGGYQQGTDPELDRAVMIVPQIYSMLTQSSASLLESDPYQQLSALLGLAHHGAAKPPRPAQLPVSRG